jgi:hypothetical protein
MVYVQFVLRFTLTSHIRTLRITRRASEAFPLWDQLHEIFGDGTASRPLSTGYSGQHDDVAGVLFGGEVEETEQGTTKGGSG